MQTFEIYSTEVEGGKETISQTVKCKSPGRLKSYKKLELEFESGKLFSYGYRVKK